VVEGAVDEVDGSVVTDSVDDGDVGLVGGMVVGGAVVEGDGSVVGVVVVGSVDEGGVVGGSVDDVGGAVVTGAVVAGSVGAVLLSWASWVMMRRTAAACVYIWLGVVVVVTSVEGAVAVDEFLPEAAFAISRPAPTRRPPTTAGISTWAQMGSSRKR
jgi:hypothetical protein